MSLYNMVMGANVNAPFCLAILDIDVETIPRMRDIWFSDDGTEIVLLTRTGGGNREAYEEQNTKLTEHELYLRDEDDSFDSTFCHFTFSVPETYQDDVKALAAFMSLIELGTSNNGPAAMVDRLDARDDVGYDSDNPKHVAAMEDVGKVFDQLRDKLVAKNKLT